MVNSRIPCTCDFISAIHSHSIMALFCALPYAYSLSISIRNTPRLTTAVLPLYRYSIRWLNAKFRANHIERSTNELSEYTAFMIHMRKKEQTKHLPYYIQCTCSIYNLHQSSYFQIHFFPLNYVYFSFTLCVHVCKRTGVEAHMPWRPCGDQRITWGQFSDSGHYTRQQVPFFTHRSTFMAPKSISLSTIT